MSRMTTKAAEKIVAAGGIKRPPGSKPHPRAKNPSDMLVMVPEGEVGGLYLWCRNGKGFWNLFRRDPNRGGKMRTDVLGRFPEMSPAEARAKACELKNGVAMPRPVAHPLSAAVAPEPIATDPSSCEAFGAAAKKFIASKRNRIVDGKKIAGEWTDDEANRRLRTLLAMPFADKPFNSIRAKDVATYLLATGWVNNQVKPGALRRSLIQRVLASAMAEAEMDIANVALWATQSALLPNPKIVASKQKHHGDDCTPYSELPALLREINDPMVTLLALTSVRVGDVIGDDKQPDKPPMSWEHIDLKNRIWTIECTKSEAALRVPLTDAMIACLGTPGTGGIFGEGREPRRRYKNLSRKVLQPRGVKLHAMRTTFTEWCRLEHPEVPKDVIEACKAHALGSKVERAYQQNDLIDQRRALMEKWSAFVATR